MSKLGSYLQPNWYHDQRWPTKDVMQLLRRNWKAVVRVKNKRAADERARKIARYNRLEVIILSPDAAVLERRDINPSYRGPPSSRLNYPYRGRGQAPAA